jgi:hypothetical protein
MTSDSSSPELARMGRVPASVDDVFEHVEKRTVVIDEQHAGHPHSAHAFAGVPRKIQVARIRGCVTSVVGERAWRVPVGA